MHDRFLDYEGHSIQFIFMLVQAKYRDIIFVHDLSIT